ncbi:MAG: hypothetical protein ABEJ26_01365 [Halosimplex sp.]
MESDRRTYLGLLAGALAGTAGCLEGDGETPTAEPTGDPEGGSSTDVPAETPRETPTPAPTRSSTATDGSSETATEGSTETATETTAGPHLVLDPVDPADGPPLTVYPTKLASMLRKAATGDGPVRERAGAFVYAPDPLLPGFDAVQIVDPVGDASGTYEVDAEGDPYYMMTLRAEEVPAEEADEPTPVSELPAEYRDFVVSVLADSGDRRRVEPQTERGEWVREHFFGEYVEYDGQVYLGKAIHPTDAVFFSTEVWYVLSLSPVEDADEPVTLRLPDIDTQVREAVDEALDEWSKNDGGPALAGPPFGDAVREFAADTERILTHTFAYSVSIEPYEVE